MAPISRTGLGQLAAALPFWMAAVAAFAPGSGAAATIAVQGNHCDPLLPVSTENSFGYRLRGDRCEGIYIQPVSSTPLVIASFGRFVEPESNGAAGTVLVEWAPDSGAVRLRAMSLRPRTYYRMDSRQGAGARSYAWRTDVRSALRLGAAEVGLVAWTRRTVGGAARDVYLPVIIREPPPARQSTYELLVIPGAELAEVFVGLSSVSADGAKRRVISKPKALGYRFYPAGRAIRIPVDSLPSAGHYVLDIGATLRDGGAISHEVWFDHAPPPKAKPTER